MTQKLKVGIAYAGIHTQESDSELTTHEKFELVKSKGCFDYIEVTPHAEDLEEYIECSTQFGLPVLSGSGNYVMGRDEPKLKENLRIAAELGSMRHNTQLFMDHVDGHLLSNDDVAEFYLMAYEWGEFYACMPCFEVHVNMWSEGLHRVHQVADLVENHGVPFNITLDHSHVVFKSGGNTSEQAAFNLKDRIRRGQLVIDPLEENNVMHEWVDRGLVAHAHARAAAQNNPKNLWGYHPSLETFLSSQHPVSLVGRGIQYPFIKPRAGQWHSPWNEADLLGWKSVMRYLLNWHAQHDESSLALITCEYIPFTDYGEGASYSLLENNAACAEWLRSSMIV